MTNTSTEPAKNLLSYQGRKVSRHRSESRRIEILCATLQIIRKDGVRGVRHRAVAKQAKVPVAATTYYFKDISDLITDAFTYYAEQSIEEFRNMNDVQAKSLIETYKIKTGMLKAGESHVPLMEELIHCSCWIIVQYLKIKLENYRYQLLVEQAFMYEAINTECLNDVGEAYHNCLLDLMERMCSAIGLENPRMCADLILGTVWVIVKRALRAPVDQFDEQAALALLKLQMLSLTRYNT